MKGENLDTALEAVRQHRLQERADLRERVVRCMRQNPDMTLTDVRRRFGISLSLIKALIAEAE